MSCLTNSPAMCTVQSCGMLWTVWKASCQYHFLQAPLMPLAWNMNMPRIVLSRQQLQPALAHLKVSGLGRQRLQRDLGSAGRGRILHEP